MPIAPVRHSFQIKRSQIYSISIDKERSPGKGALVLYLAGQHDMLYY